MSLHQMRRNDTRPHFRVRLDIAGEPIDLTGSTVRFHMSELTSNILKIDRPAVVLQTSTSADGDMGEVEYRWDGTGDTGVSGLYGAEWEVTFPDGTKQTFPTTVRDRVTIMDDLV